MQLVGRVFSAGMTRLCLSTGFRVARQRSVRVYLHNEHQRASLHPRDLGLEVALRRHSGLKLQERLKTAPILDQGRHLFGITHNSPPSPFPLFFLAKHLFDATLSAWVRVTVVVGYYS